jgi:hypothetical protein
MRQTCRSTEHRGIVDSQHRSGSLASSKPKMCCAKSAGLWHSGCHPSRAGGTARSEVADSWQGERFSVFSTTCQYRPSDRTVRDRAPCARRC